MIMRNRIAGQRWIAAVVFLFALSEVPAHAYLDPGTGSMVAQAIIAALAGAAFVLRASWARVRAFIRPLFGRSDSGDSK